MNRRTAMAGIVLAPLAGCAGFTQDMAKVEAVAGKVAVTIQTDAPTIVTAVSSAMGIGMEVLKVVSNASPAGLAINTAIALATPILARVVAAVAASASPVAADLAALQGASNSLIAAASGSYAAVAKAV